MKYVKMLGLAAIAAAALTAWAGAGSASATELDCSLSPTAMCPANTTIHAEANGVTELHPPFGGINCKKSTVHGTTANTGSATETVFGNLSALTFGECNAVVTVEAPGALEIHTDPNDTGPHDGNGILTSKNAKVTVEYLGFHCIFTTSAAGTTVGTVTGSKVQGENAVFDIAATIPRTGGRSGAFCGTTAQWTGSYTIKTPSTLVVT